MSDDVRQNLGRRMAGGAAWMILLRLVDRLLGIVSTTILARLLLPADFGLVALAVSVVAIIETFANFNIDAALVRDRKTGTGLYDSAWTINVAAACALAFFIVLGADLAAAFFNEPRVAPILYWLAAATAIGGFANIGTVEFQKELDFRKDFNFQFTARILSMVLTIAAALMWRDYWALVIGSASRTLFRVCLSYLVHPYRPRFSVAHVRPLLSFSRWLLADNVIGGVNSRLSQIVLGRLTAVDLLAFYSLGAEIARLATTEVQAPIRRAIYPGFAAVADHRESLKQMFLSSAAVLTFIGLPVAVGIGFTADYAVILLLGDRWLPTIPIVQILTLGGILTALRTGSHLVYYAVNRPQLNLWLGAVALIVAIPLLVLGVRADGIEGAAWASVAVALILLIVDYAILMPILRVSAGRLLAVMWRPMCSAGTMAVALSWIRPMLSEPRDWRLAAANLAVCVVVGAAVYAGTALAVWRLAGRSDGAERSILAGLLRPFARKRA